MLGQIDAGIIYNALVGLGVIVAIVSVHTSRVIAGKRESAHLLFTTRGDDTLQEAHRVVRERFESEDKNLQSLVKDYESEDARALRYLLNHFETVSVGIQSGIYNEAMLKRCWCTILVTAYDQTHSYITALRSRDQSPTVYQEFEWLAKRWKKRRIKPRN